MPLICTPSAVIAPVVDNTITAGRSCPCFACYFGLVSRWSGPPEAFLGGGQRVRPGHPVGDEDRPTGAAKCCADVRVVIDDHSDLASVGEAAEQARLGDAGRPAVALRPHDQSALGESV